MRTTPLMTRSSGKSRSSTLLSHDKGRMENAASNDSTIVAGASVAAVKSLPSRYLAIRVGYTYKHTVWWDGFMNYAVETGSCAIIYTLSFIKFGSHIQKLMQVDTQAYNFFSLLSLFWKKWKQAYAMSIPSGCLCIHPYHFWMAEPIFMKVGVYAMASGPISTACFINLSHQSVSYVYSPIAARQQLGKNVNPAMNTHGTREKLFGSSFSIWSVPYQGK
jgi:hypothetical protein